MSRIFATENRVYAAREVHHDTHLYVGQKVIISSRETGRFGEEGEISALYAPTSFFEVGINLTNLGIECEFTRSEFRVHAA